MTGSYVNFLQPLAKKPIQCLLEPIHFWSLACVPTPGPVCDSEAEISESMSIGTWVIVKYDMVNFPGEVTAIIDGDVEVNVMHRSGQSNWKWPSPAHKILYSKQDVVKIISPPKQ